MIIGNTTLDNKVVFNITKIGQRHILKNKPCEDSSCTYIDEYMAIACVADGHGDERCARAKKGSELACLKAKDSIVQFVQSHPNIVLKDTKEIDKVLVQLKSYILQSWLRAVDEDIKEHPLQENEKLVVGTTRDVYIVYGTTLLAACATKNFWFALQIGDGDIVVKHKKQKYVMEPDDACFANTTSSMCDTNALYSFRHYYSRKIPTSIFLTTDGFKNSFKGDTYFFATLEKVEEDIRESGTDKARESVGSFLETLTEKGSGDDISIGFIG